MRAGARHGDGGVDTAVAFRDVVGWERELERARMAFARGHGVIDGRNVGCAHHRIEEFYFVYFSDEVGVGDRVKLADKKRLVIR
jgi:hypothetical protein